MIRHATKDDVSRIAELLVFGKRTAYRAICDFYVEPVFQGMGIGRELLYYFIREAKAEHRKRIFLWVIKDNLHARKFYELNGFTADGQEKLIEGTSVMDKRYVKEL